LCVTATASAAEASTILLSPVLFLVLQSTIISTLRTVIVPLTAATAIVTTFNTISLQLLGETGFDKSVSLGSGLYCCGDHRGTATLNGALETGIRAADAVLNALMKPIE
jgi:hypothetical protein